MVIKKFNGSESAQKIHASINTVTSMRTNFGECHLSSFGDIATFKNGQISLSDHGLYSPWSSKNLMNWNWL